MKKLSLILALALTLASFAFAKFTCENGKLFLKDGNKVYPASYEFSNDYRQMKIHFRGKNENQMDLPSDLNKESKKDYETLENCSEVKTKRQEAEQHLKQKHSSRK